MAAIKHGFDGMEALLRGLRQLPEDLKREARAIVASHTNSMASEVIAEYPEDTGTLTRGVSVEIAPDGLSARVRSRAQHAHLYEYGTVARHTSGTGARRGAMESKPTFVPAAVRHRGRMVRHLRAVGSRVKVDGMDGTLDLQETSE